MPYAIEPSNLIKRFGKTTALAGGSRPGLVGQAAGSQAARADTHGAGPRSTAAQALQRLPDRDVQAAMQSLPDDSRIVIYLADVEGLSYRQIAEITSTSIGTVMSRLHDGRQQLRTRLLAAVDRAQSLQGPDSGPVAAPRMVEQLTPRELEVLHLLATGRSNLRIAHELVVTVDTVKKHVSHLLDKLGANNRTEAVVRAWQLDLVR